MSTERRRGSKRILLEASREAVQLADAGTRSARAQVCNSSRGNLDKTHQPIILLTDVHLQKPR